MSVYLIDGYNLLHQILGQHDTRRGAGRPGRQARGRGGSQAGAGQARRGAGNDLTLPEEAPGERRPVADLEDERRRLLDRIASYMGGTSDRAVVVFDSHSQVLQKSESATRQVEVYFGSFTHSADAIIEREVYALSPGQTVVVVSSDYVLQQTIFLPNVVRRSSREFANELQEDTKRIANRQNCITMSHRIEERIPSGTLEKLARLRDRLQEDAASQEDPPRSG